MKTALCHVLGGIIAVLSLSCGNRDITKSEPLSPARDSELRIGLSQPNVNTPWKVAETNSIIKMAESIDAELIIADAEGSTPGQLKDIERLLAQNLDYLILSPRDFNSFGAVLGSAADVGTSVILIDKAAPGTPRKDYLTLIQGDFLSQGRMAARILKNEFLDREVELVEIIGVPGTSASIERAVGLQLEIIDAGGITLVDRLSGENTQKAARQAMESLIQNPGLSFNAVFAHSDQMALGVIQALRNAGDGYRPGEDVMVVSINGEKDALKSIIAGNLLATIDFSPMVGDIIQEVITKDRKKELMDLQILIPGRIISIDNVDEFEGY